MCGISGIILRRGERANGSLTAAMAKDMAHRGPDAQSVFTKNHFSLAHRRLKVIDISDDANQPLFNKAGDVGIVFNGEIYNFLELKKELEERGHTFRTRSDTEVIVHAFEEWGPDCIAKFNGMFAFALWDGRGQEDVFFLARDKNGIKPLFYSWKEQRLGFSSELTPLLRLPWVSKSVDQSALFYYLKFSHVPNPQSILNDVLQLEPGHYLLLKGAQLEKKAFWDSRSACASPTLSGTEAEWEERFAACLKATVKRQIVSDVPLGCFLSGGVDSSLLTMAFSKASQQKVKTFSIGYKDSQYDERSYARQVANAFETDHQEILVGPQDFRDLIPDIPKFFDQPFADPAMLPSMVLCKHARNSVTVALSGDGADELFWGYDYQRILRKMKPMVHVPSILRRGLFGALSAPIGAFSDRARKFLEILQFHNESELFQYFVGTVGPLRLDRLAGLMNNKVDLTVPIFTPLLKAASGMPWENKIDFIFQNTFLVDTVLAKSDRASMAYGLELRVPFLDDEMVALSSSMPFDMKWRHNRSKFILRSVLGKELPKNITERKKQGFSIPLPSWLRTDLKYLLDDFIEGDVAHLGEWLNIGALRQLAREHQSGRKNHSHLLWSVICLGLWKDRYLNP